MPSSGGSWRIRVRHILEALAENQGYVVGKTYEGFCQDSRTLKAVVWNLTVIGEAARHVPETIAALYPEIPWARMRGMRNRIVHGYDRIDWELVWKAVQEELSPLSRNAE